MTDAIDTARDVFVSQRTKSSHDDNVLRAQQITQLRYALYQASKLVYPKDYPLPPAGNGADIFKAADEAGEGIVTYKEMSKYIGRNQSTLKILLQEGFGEFNDQFSIEDLRDMDAATFMGIWQAAAKVRDMPADEKKAHLEAYAEKKEAAAEAVKKAKEEEAAARAAELAAHRAAKAEEAA